MAAKAFQTSGPITDFDKTVYIERNEDKEVLNYIRGGKHVTILGARQTGKTSLLYNIERQLGEGYIPIYIDLSAGDSIKDEREWYQQFLCERILAQVSDRFTSDVGKQKLVPAESKIGFFNFINQVALGVKPSDRIVMMLDEFGTVPEFLNDNFFGAIRTVTVERTIDRKGFEKWIFVLAGSTEPGELISLQSKNSPFNITQRIYMSDFDKEGTRQVVENLKAHGIQLEKGEELINRIHEQTGGHPFLVQVICDRLKNSDTISIDSVNQAINGLTVPQRIYDELNKDKEASQLVIRILGGGKEFFDRSKIKAKLTLLGVIKRGKDGNCIIHNPIYEKALIARLREVLQDIAAPSEGWMEAIRKRLRQLF
ncbi:hypothetical protein FJZ31_16495 [Candidatus Poribacteria bacterium]|nr:hypothetical protein [Candidatus Poribacteria bacterium]